MIEVTSFKYRAFLSYSHRDKRWAEWLHSALESYRIETDLIGRDTPLGPVPRTLRPIFRDREDFSAGHSLKDQTEEALQISQFLIVICSPNAAQSQYVNEEIRYFKAIGRADQIIAFIVGGEPGDPRYDCFPPALRFNVVDNRILTASRDEPIAADARPLADGKEIAKLKVVAGLLGLGLDEIVRREERARRDRLRKWVGALVITSVTFASLAIWAEINRQEAVAQRTLAKQRQLEAESNFSVAKQAADALVFDIAQGLREVEGMRTEAVRKILDRAEQAFNRLVENSNGDQNLLRSQAAMLSQFADVYSAQGDTERQLAAARGSLDIMERLTKIEPGNTEWQRDLSISYDRVGNSLRAEGKLLEALNAFQHSLVIRERLMVIGPANTEWQRDLSVSYGKVGDVSFAIGNRADALTAFRKGIALAEIIRKADYNDMNANRDLAISYDKLAVTLVAGGDLSEALKIFQSNLTTRERVLAADPTNTELQRDVAVAHANIGAVLKAQRKPSDALLAMQNGLAIDEHLANSDSKNLNWQRDMFVDYHNIGSVFLEQNNLPDALKAFRDALRIAKRLAAADSSNAQRQSDLALAYHDTSDVLFAQKNLKEALDTIGESLKIAIRLAQSDPNNMEWQSNLSDIYRAGGTLLIAAGDKPHALTAFSSSVAIAERLTKVDPRNAEWQWDLVLSNWAMAINSDDSVPYITAVIDALSKLGEHNDLTVEQTRLLSEAQLKLEKLRGRR